MASDSYVNGPGVLLFLAPSFKTEEWKQVNKTRWWGFKFQINTNDIESLQLNIWEFDWIYEDIDPTFKELVVKS